ncbi:hypothetical protein LRS06_13475 [Hymenobacter sp. J193]|uniref:hypothetical protein n=1 Tax=Hymenobacter sp. J193 TaxID=2898429 RepID=UPI002150B41B|nr:hypothetical protein [Hymenobacter sp. J193]MCR5888760.1 hypothetical protein [Hymenobacter sp. J193]
MLELIALVLLQLATFLNKPNGTVAPKPINTLETGGGSWGEGQATSTTPPAATGGGSWGEGQVSKP